MINFAFQISLICFLIPNMEVLYISYHIWKSYIYPTIYGSLISYHIWKSYTYPTIYGSLIYPIIYGSLMYILPYMEALYIFYCHDNWNIVESGIKHHSTHYIYPEYPSLGSHCKICSLVLHRPWFNLFENLPAHE